MALGREGVLPVQLHRSTCKAVMESVVMAGVMTVQRRVGWSWMRVMWRWMWMLVVVMRVQGCMIEGVGQQQNMG